MSVLALAACSLPFSSWRVAAFLGVITLPVAFGLLLAYELALAGSRRVRLFRRLKPVTPRLATRLTLTGGATAIVVLVGLALSNVLLADEPLDAWTLAGYAVTGLVAAGLAAGVWVGTGRMQRPMTPRTLVSLVCSIAGVTAVVADSTLLVRAYDAIHLTLFCSGLVAFGIVSSLIVSSGSPRRTLLIAVGAVGTVGATVTVAADPSASIQAVVRSPTSARRALDVARRLADADGDTHAAMLGGGDCNDADGGHYPLSRGGLDCLGWREPTKADDQRLEARDVPLAARGDRDRAPPVSIVLVTLESFRCTTVAFDVAERRRACPNLARLGDEGQIRWDAWTGYPATSGAVLGMMTEDTRIWDMDARPVEPTTTWVRWLKGLGYATHAVATTPHLMVHAIVRNAFDVIDRSLMRASRRPVAVTARRTTDVTLEHLQQAGSTPIFVWAHYYDPHAPYVASADAHWSTNELKSYRAEVARVDAEVGRLARALAALPDSGRRLLIVTADHGEEFGGHGNGYHGLTLYEPVLQVPLLVWAPHGKTPDLVRTELPMSTTDMGALIRHATTGSPYAPADHAIAALHRPSDPQLAVRHDGMKLIYHRRYHFMELFDLSKDPRERVDLSDREAWRIAELGRLMGRALDASVTAPVRDDHDEPPVAVFDIR